MPMRTKTATERERRERDPERVQRLEVVEDLEPERDGAEERRDER